MIDISSLHLEQEYTQSWPSISQHTPQYSSPGGLINIWYICSAIPLVRCDVEPSRRPRYPRAQLCFAIVCVEMVLRSDSVCPEL